MYVLDYNTAIFLDRVNDKSLLTYFSDIVYYIDVSEERYPTKLEDIKDPNIKISVN